MRYWNLYIIYFATVVLLWNINTYMRGELMSEEIKINPSIRKPAWSTSKNINIETARGGDVFYFECVVEGIHNKIQIQVSNSNSREL